MAIPIPLTPAQHDQLADEMARLACAAYYRAKLEPLYFPETSDEEAHALEGRLKAMVEKRYSSWLASAKAFLSMAYVFVKCEDDNGA